MPSLLDEPAADTLLVVWKAHVCPVTLCFGDLSQVRKIFGASRGLDLWCPSFYQGIC